MTSHLRLVILGEAVVLQAAADLWNLRYRAESLAFFRGEGFAFWSQTLQLSADEKKRFWEMIAESARM